MNKQISTPILVGAISTIVLIFAVIGWMVFGGSAGSNADQPVMIRAQREAREK